SSAIVIAFILSYAALFVVAGGALAATVGAMPRPWISRLPRAAVVLGVGAATANLVDKLALLLVVHGNPRGAAPGVAYGASIATYALLLSATVTLAIGLAYAFAIWKREAATATTPRRNGEWSPGDDAAHALEAATPANTPAGDGLIASTPAPPYVAVIFSTVPSDDT